MLTATLNAIAYAAEMREWYAAQSDKRHAADAAHAQGRYIAEAGGMLSDCGGDPLVEAGWQEYHSERAERSKQEMIELAREAAWMLRAAFVEVAKVGA